MRKFLFRFSAVCDNNMTIEAESYEEAVKQYHNRLKQFVDELKNVCDGTESKWDYDGNVCDEGDEELGCIKR